MFAYLLPAGVLELDFDIDPLPPAADVLAAPEPLPDADNRMGVRPGVLRSSSRESPPLDFLENLGLKYYSVMGL